MSTRRGPWRRRRACPARPPTHPQPCRAHGGALGLSGNPAEAGGRAAGKAQGRAPELACATGRKGDGADSPVACIEGGTRRVLTRYSPLGTHGVLTGYSRDTHLRLADRRGGVGGVAVVRVHRGARHAPVRGTHGVLGAVLTGYSGGYSRGTHAGTHGVLTRVLTGYSRVHRGARHAPVRRLGTATREWGVLKGVLTRASLEYSRVHR